MAPNNSSQKVLCCKNVKVNRLKTKKKSKENFCVQKTLWYKKNLLQKICMSKKNFLKNVGQNFILVDTKFNSKKIVRPKVEFYRKSFDWKKFVTKMNVGLKK